MIVIFDTNVWISDLALTSNVGSAVRFYLRNQNARVGLPEVVRLETEVHLRTVLNEYIQQIEKNHRQLLSVFGRLKEIVLPTPDEVESLIGRVFSELDVAIEPIPFSLSSAKSSLTRAVQKVPPSDKNEQFKDGVLWEDCLAMLKTEAVFLVSADKAFYKSRDYNSGLAEELARDLDQYPNELRIFPTLVDLLSMIGTGVEIPAPMLISSYMAAHREKIEEMARRNGFSLDGEPIVHMDIIATENAISLFVNFTIDFPCVDTTSEGKSSAHILCRGQATYDASAKRFLEVANRGEKLSYRLPDGTEEKRENYVLVAGGIVIGHRTVEHSVRVKL